MACSTAIATSSSYRRWGLGASATLTWVLRVVSDRTQRRFRDRVTIALESHVAQLQATVAMIAHHERPDLLDRLAVLRDQVFVLDHMYMSLFSTAGWIFRLGVTIALLASAHPALIFLAAFALPRLLTSTWRPGVERAAEERGAPAQRLARHLFDIATKAVPGKEIRVAGLGEHLVDQRRAAWERWYAGVSSACWTGASYHTAGWAVYGAAYVGAMVFVAYGIRANRARYSWCWQPGRAYSPISARPSARLVACAGSGWTVRGGWLGWKTTRHRWSKIATKPSPNGWMKAFVSKVFRSRIQVPTRSSSITLTWISKRARSSARMVRARARW